MAIKINTPLTRETARTLKCGDSVEITGVIYTARDAAHKRLCQLLDEGKPLPVDLTDGIIYFAGPAPAKPATVGFATCTRLVAASVGTAASSIRTVPLRISSTISSKSSAPAIRYSLIGLLCA